VGYATAAGTIKLVTLQQGRPERLCRAQANPTGGRYVMRQHAKGNRACRLDPHVVAIVEAKIDRKFLVRPPITFDTLHAHVVTAIGDWNAAHQQAAPLTAPSLDAVRRRVLLRSPRDVAAAREGEARARQRFDMVHSQPDPEAPLDLVELDHTVSDVFVVCGRTFLPFGRATLAASICRCTRMPVGIYLGFEPPSVHTVMQCLRNGMLPKTYLDEKVASGEWNIKHGWPVCGRPRTLLLDRGMENLGGDLDAFPGEVGINLRFAPQKSPWFKGAIERFFRTLNQRLLHEQRGTTLSNVVARDDYDPAKNAVITQEELLHALHKWLLDVYACTIHRGMRDVPARLWGELTVLHPIQPVSSIADLDSIFGRVEHRVLQRTGLTFEHVRFTSEGLVSLLADARFPKASPDRKIRFRYDPADVGMIRAHDPCEAWYIEVPAWDQEYAKGLSIWQHRQIVAYENRRNAGAADFEGCARAKVEVAAVFEAAMADRRTGSRKKAARHDGVGRLAPAGSSHETTPQGSVEAMRRDAPPLGARTKPAKSSKAIAAAPVPSLQPDDNDEDIYAALGIAR